jgi:hypothetical protein
MTACVAAVAHGSDAMQDRSRLDWIKRVADAARCNLPSGAIRVDENTTRSPRRAAFEETPRLRVSWNGQSARAGMWRQVERMATESQACTKYSSRNRERQANTAMW